VAGHRELAGGEKPVVDVALGSGNEIVERAGVEPQRFR
jgi:hypothetical protein